MSFDLKHLSAIKLKKKYLYDPYITFDLIHLCAINVPNTQGSLFPKFDQNPSTRLHKGEQTLKTKTKPKKKKKKSCDP